MSPIVHQSQPDRLIGFMNLMQVGNFFSAFDFALRHGLPKEFVDRSLTFAYSKVNRGRSEYFRKRILHLVFGRDADLSDPMALYSTAMDREQYFLAALLLQEDMVGMEPDVIEKLTKSAVQAAFLQASATFDRSMMERLTEAFPLLFDASET